MTHTDAMAAARASATQSLDLGCISLSRVMPKDFKKQYLQHLLGAQHKKDSGENKPASSLVVSMGGNQRYTRLGGPV